MNQLSLEKRAEILNILVNGNGIRTTAALAKCAINTVMKILVDVGGACQKYHDENVRQVNSKRVQVDEIWSFYNCKKKNLYRSKTYTGGDVWTWTAIDCDSRLIVSWAQGSRDNEIANCFIQDLAMRVDKIQLTSDGLLAYLEPVTSHFKGRVDYAQLQKIYGNPIENGVKINRTQYLYSVKNIYLGNPDPKHISTSYVERHNLTMRMLIKRFARKTNCHSKKLLNHAYATAIHLVYYNFVREHTSLSTTPAIAAGITDKKLTLEDMVRLSDSNSK